MPDEDYAKRKKKADADCGCHDEEWAAEAVEAFAKAIQEDVQVDLHPDPRGTTVRRWRGLIAPYGLPTGDGRRFKTGALLSRELPLPVKWQRTDSSGHSTSVIVGRIDGINYADEGVDAWGIMFDPDVEKLPRLAEDANEAYHLLKERVIGPSVDLDDMDYHTLPSEAGELSADAKQEIEVTKGRISAITLVQIPAFAEARPFALDDLDANEYAEMTAVTAAAVSQGMEQLPVADIEWSPVDWLVEALETDSVGALYAKGDVALFPVASLVDGTLSLVPGAVADAVSVLAYHDQDVDLPEGEKQVLRIELEALTAACGLPTPPWAQAALVASAGTARASSGPLPAQLFDRPKMDGPTPVKIERVGEHLHYYGHVATWGVCHIGFPGQCVTAPKSRTNYAYFHNGPITTDKGPIRTGKVTLGGGHADVRAGFQAAVSHYDDAGAAVADVRAGEDEYGIWVSGVVRAGVDDARLAELAAAPLSGDWRHVSGGLEMVAALAVNTPGFPVVSVSKRGGTEYALVAAGALQPEHPADDTRVIAPGDTQAAIRAEIARDRRVRKAAGDFSVMMEEHRLETRQRAFAAAHVFG